MSFATETSFERWSGPGRRRQRQRERLRRVSLVAAGIRPARAIPLRFSQEIVIASLMALCPEVNWDGFKWPMIEDLLVDDSHFQWLTYMQNRPDWGGHSFGFRLVGPLERTAILSLHWNFSSGRPRLKLWALSTS